MADKTLHTIIVFPDGTTWNTVEGCKILTITDEDFANLCDDFVDAKDIEPLSEIILT